MKHTKLLKLLAGFLSCMLLFTILSRAADSAGIAVVSTGTSRKMAIDHSVSGSGKVVQNREEAVSTLANQTVKTIYVSEGSQVEEGEVLFEIDLDDLKEQIVEKKQELEKLKLQGEDVKSQAEANEAKKSLAENQARENLSLAAQRGNLTVSAAVEELNEALEKLNAYRESQGKAVVVLEDGVRDQLVLACKEKKEAYEKADEELTRLQNEIERKVSEALQAEEAKNGSENTGGSQGAGSSGEASSPAEPLPGTDAVPSTEAPIETEYPDRADIVQPEMPDTGDVPQTEKPGVADIPQTETPDTGNNSQIGTSGNGNTPQTEAPGTADIPQTETPGTGNDSQAGTPDNGNTLQTEATGAADIPQTETPDTGNVSEPEIELIPQAAGSAAENGLQTEILRTETAFQTRAIPAAKILSQAEGAPIVELPSSCGAIFADHSTQARVIPKKLTFTASQSPVVVIDSQSSPSDGSGISEAERAVRNQYASQLKAAKEKAEKAKEEQEKADAALAAYDEEKLVSEQASADETEQQLLSDVQAKQQAYDSALLSSTESVTSASHSLQNAQAPDGSDSSAAINELDQEALELQIAKMEKLLDDQGKITSPVKGIVTGLSITTGNKTPDGMAVLLADTTAGCKFVAEIPKAQEKYVGRNDEVTLTPTNGSPLEGFTVDSVTASESQEDMVKVTVLLKEGVMELGESAEFKVAKNSGPYMTCIPISALHEDNSEKYVYVLQEKESVLGKETVVRKLNVTVQDKNSQYAALADGQVSDSQKIVTGTDKIISDGSRVRVSE